MSIHRTGVAPLNTSCFAYLWAVLREDGQPEYFTSHDEDIVVPWPPLEATIRFRATGGIAVSNQRSEAGLRAANRDLSGMLGAFSFGVSPGSWTAAEQMRYLGATVHEWRVDWRWPIFDALDVITYKVTTDQVDRDTVLFQMQQKSLLRLREHHGAPFGRNCRWSLGEVDGDGRGCGNDRTAQGGVHITLLPNRTYANRLVTVIDNSRRAFRIQNLALPTLDLFTNGTATFQSGDNIDLEFEISHYDETVLDANNSGIFYLAEYAPGEIELNDIVTVVEGCDGSFDKCKVFGNTLNFGGEKDTPGSRRARQPAPVPR